MLIRLQEEHPGHEHAPYALWYIFIRSHFAGSTKSRFYGRATNILNKATAPIDLLGDGGPGEEWTPSGCCNRTESGHPRAAFQRR